MNVEKNPTTGKSFEFFGPTIELLTSPEDEHNDFCVLRGIIPPGVVVPLHSHADTEDFLIISGELEALTQNTQGYAWIVAKEGDYVHIPGDAQHAWRNVSGQSAVALIITTKKMGRFFQEAGRP